MMMVSHTTDLAVDFGRKVRNIIDTDAYRMIFPTVNLAADSKSAGRWNTNVGGEYFACGIGSSIAGRGADLLLIDDPHSEQDVLNGNFDVFDKAYEWFAYGARTRLMPGGRVAIIQTRWHLNDLTGRVVKDMGQNEGADQYEVIEFPAILDIDQPDGSIIQKPLWPEFFDMKALATELLAAREALDLTADLSTPYRVLIRNLDTINSLQVGGYDAVIYPNIVYPIRIAPGEFCLLPRIDSGWTTLVKSSAGTVKIMVQFCEL